MLCPNAVRVKKDKKKPFICKKMTADEGVDITKADPDKLIDEYMCPLQRYCPTKGETINSEYAKSCKLRQSYN